jgi:hypothetical protein
VGLPDLQVQAHHTPNPVRTHTPLYADHQNSDNPESSSMKINIDINAIAARAIDAYADDNGHVDERLGEADMTEIVDYVDVAVNAYLDNMFDEVREQLQDEVEWEVQR